MRQLVFDNDFIEVKRKTIKISIIVLLILIITILMLFIIKKKHYYQNSFEFIDNKMAIIVVDPNNLEDIKQKKQIVLKNVSYDFSIEKIEEYEAIYLLTISFQQELDIKTTIYQFLLNEENLISYITRIIKGE